MDSITIQSTEWNDRDRRARCRFSIAAPVLFDIDIQVQLSRDGREIMSHHIRQASWDIAWLPQGEYEVSVTLPVAEAGQCQLQWLIWSNANGRPVLQASAAETADGGKRQDSLLAKPDWQLRSPDCVPDLNALSWTKGHDDWFFRHFDHAARVIVYTMLDESPLLRGRILDVGCGDGITDLGVFLRCQPEQFVGVDPFEGYRRLPQLIADNHLPAEVLDDPRLQFRADDGNRLGFADDSFDVVLSWGSLEHIAGGYRQTLEEIRRVLKPDGLFFCHPGLYYGPLGNHLNEFFDDPWIHLKLDREELKRKVLSTAPRYMDRAGEFSSAEQYWQWYTELNPITVSGFEQELRGMGFEPWRVALRHHNLVEYTEQLQPHSFQDLATAELYLSAYNRK